MGSRHLIIIFVKAVVDFRQLISVHSQIIINLEFLYIEKKK